MLTRRDLLTLAAAGTAAAALPVERLVSSLVGTTGESATAKPFTQPLSIPPTLQPVQSTDDVDIYRMHLREARVEVVPGQLTTVRTFDGHFPGPTIRASRGRRVVITQYNDLNVPTAVHLHGGSVRPEDDGHPMDFIAPGTSREYHYPNRQVAASLWYHDHAHEIEAENVYRGLYGAYLIADPDELRLPLPRGRFDVPLHIRDARIEQDGTLAWVRPLDRHHMLVNGRERPYFPVAARRYRLRLYNLSTDLVMRLRLSDGVQFVQIASDGGLLAAPVPSTEVRLSPAERAEIVVDFARYPVGSSVYLQDAGARPTENPDLLRFDIGRPVPDPTSVPDTLGSVPELPTPTVQRRIVLSSDWQKLVFPINGSLFDPDRVDIETTVGTTEVWEITNADLPTTLPYTPHNFHAHLVQFRVLQRNGAPPSAAESGWKDTVLMLPGETVRVAMTWGPYAGRYLFHCHNLVHSGHGQMGVMEIGP